jgi:hypothetical protein
MVSKSAGIGRQTFVVSEAHDLRTWPLPSDAVAFEHEADDCKLMNTPEGLCVS